MNWMKLVPSAVLGILGLFYVAAPHTLHVSSGASLGLDHTYHMVLGLVLLVIAAVVYFKDKIMK